MILRLLLSFQNRWPENKNIYPLKPFGVQVNRVKIMNIEDVARICHEANGSLCVTQGDFSQTSWDEAPEWQKTSARNGVIFHLQNPDAGTDDSHNSWLKEKEENGWKFGPVKDAEKKEHPCFVPYDQLPPEQQAKDFLFRGIVHSLRSFVVKEVEFS